MADKHEELFDEAVKIVGGTGPIEPDTNQKLEFYAYYKIATETDADKVPKKADRPGFTNFTARYKWDAWEKHWLALAEELKLKHDNEGLTDKEKEERRVILSKKAKQIYVEKLIAILKAYDGTDTEEVNGYLTQLGVEA